MKKVPAQLDCDVCGAPATVQLFDELAKARLCRCREHEPDRTPGVRSNLVVLRHRLSPGNGISVQLAANERSPEHRSLREEMCELGILGAYGACRYYLSILTRIDHFALWDDEFMANALEYVAAKTRGAAKMFVFDCGSIELMLPLLKAEFYKVRPRDKRPLSKAEVAVS